MTERLVPDSTANFVEFSTLSATGMSKTKASPPVLCLQCAILLILMEVTNDDCCLSCGVLRLQRVSDSKYFPEVALLNLECVALQQVTCLLTDTVSYSHDGTFLHACRHI